jgi:hypothetical protein
MRNILILILIITVNLIACTKRPVQIDEKLLYGNWISIKDKFNNIFNLTIEEKLMFENLWDAIDPIAPYKLSNDTLILFPLDYNKYPSIKTKSFKLKVLSLDSSRLELKLLSSSTTDTIIFYRTKFKKKNDFNVKRLEFSSSPCFGSCPCQDLLIDQDSLLYHYGYNSFSRHKGYSRHKLTPKEYSRILLRLNSIDKDAFRLCSPAPDAQHYHLFLKTQNDSIEIDGMICKDLTQEILDLVQFLNILEYFVPLDSIEGDGPSLKYRYNHDNFLKINNR